MAADPEAPRPRRRRDRKTVSSRTAGDAHVELSPDGATPPLPEIEAAPVVVPATKRQRSGGPISISELVVPAEGSTMEAGTPERSKRRRRAIAAPPTPAYEPAPASLDDDAWTRLRAAAAAREPDSRGEPAAQRTSSLGPAIRAAVAVAGAAGVAIVALAAVLLASGDRLPSAGLADEPQETTAVVNDVLGSVSIEETFDDLPMDSTLAEPWTIDGDGPVRVVALPTSVDRSIRISSDTSGGATSVCRATGQPLGKALRIALDYRLGRSLPRSARLVELRASATAVFALVIDAATGRVIGIGGPEMATSGAPPAGGAPPAASGAPNAADGQTSWRRVQLTISDAGELTWQANDRSGADIGSGSLGVDAGGAGIDTICIHSPAGAPAGWVALDDLLIEG